MSRQLLVIGVLCFLSAAAGVLLYNLVLLPTQPPVVIRAPDTGAADGQQKAPVFEDLALYDVEGKLRYLTEWNDTPVMLLNFWAPWCEPCRREIPLLKTLQQELDGKIQIIGLSFDNRQSVVDFQLEQRVNYPLLLVQDEAMMLSDFFDNRSGALPFSVVLDPSRNVVFSHSGEVSRADLEAAIKPLI